MRLMEIMSVNITFLLVLLGVSSVYAIVGKLRYNLEKPEESRM